jgi:agmatinase
MAHQVALLGLPIDEYSSHLKGAAGAPAAIRRALFSDETNPFTEEGLDIAAPSVLDDRDDMVLDVGEDPWPRIEVEVDAIIAAGARPLLLGGDHSVTHPILRSVRRHHLRLALVHIDAHPDLYEDFGGTPRSHASPIARILEEGLADRVVQIGIRSTTTHQQQQQARYGVEVFEMKHLGEMPRIIFNEPVYVTIDIDALDPAHAPGVSHREPGGLSTRELLSILHGIDGDVIGGDIVEYNPARDQDGVTAAVAAKIAKEMIGILRGR